MDAAVITPRSEIKRLADAIIPRPNGDKYVAALAIYGDESASERVFVLSVLIAPVDRWSQFEQHWKGALEDAGLRRADGAFIPFHMADYESRMPPFDSWDQTKR